MGPECVKDANAQEDCESHRMGGSQLVSRREFLKTVGIVGATVGVGAGLGGLVAACGGTTTTTTAVTTATTTGAETTATTVAGSSTTAGPQAGRPIKVGFVSPTTGALASFAIPDKYCVQRWTESVGDGIVCADGQKHPVSFMVADSQSDSNRAAQVAGGLISGGIDIMLAATTGDTVPPVAAQCEANGVPCLSTDCPWETYWKGMNGDPNVGLKWSYHAFWGVTESAPMYFSAWSAVSTNKVVAALWPNDSDGNAYRKSWPILLPKQGYKVVDGGSFQDGTEDYTSMVAKFKTEGAEICSGVMNAADFTNFYKQAKQQSFNPKIVSIGKAAQLPQTLTALGGALGIGLCSSMTWSPTWPWKSSLTGETAQQLADDFYKKMNLQWMSPLCHYMLFEMAADALKRTKVIDDKESIIEAVRTIKMTTMNGPIDFTEPVDAKGKRPVSNVYRTAFAVGQWVKGTKYPFDFKICANDGWPDIPLEAKLQPVS